MYWICEPHGDDAMLSVGHHITTRWKGIPKTIVTVFATPKRKLEAEAYAKSVNCRHICLSLQESGGLSKQAGFVPEFSEWEIPFGKGDVLIYPIGLQHPDHLAVVEQLDKVKAIAWRYLDTPYYTKIKLAEELQEKMQGCTIRSIAYATMHKWNAIKFFKSQSKFFFYNPPKSLPRIEVVVKCQNQ